MPIGLLCPACSYTCHKTYLRSWVSGAVTRPPSCYPPLGLCDLCVVFICAQTLCCANTVDDGLLQVTPQDVRVVDAATGALVHQWTAPAGLHINTASASPTQVSFPSLLLSSGQPNHYNTAYHLPGACKLRILRMGRSTPA